MTKPGSSDSHLSPRRPRWVVPAAVVGVLVLAGAGAIFWFFSGDAPAEVDLEATAAAVTEAPVDGSTTTAAPPEGGIDGQWSVDTSVGDFTVESDTTATFVGFRVDEELSTIGSTTAVGRTPGVTGTIAISGTTVTSVEVVADMTAIVSDQSRREGAIQRALNTGANPTAAFSLSDPIDLGSGAEAGDIVSTAASGQLTVNGITNDITLEIEAQLIGDLILITGTTDVVFADYDITAPTAPIVVSVEDNGVIEFQLWMAR